MNRNASLFFAVIILTLLWHSCSKNDTIVTKPINEIRNPYKLPLTFTYLHQQNEFNSQATIGLWMFKNDHIANWLGEDDNGKEIYEPINVLWIDYSADTKEEALFNISEFLIANGYKTRRGSSTGYFSYIGVQPSPEFTPQSPTDKTWSDGNAWQENNHGRLFTASSASGGAFYSLISLSRETAVTHHFVSFKSARESLKAQKSWQLEQVLTNIANAYPPGSNEHFSTKDHDAISVFVKYP